MEYPKMGGWRWMTQNTRTYPIFASFSSIIFWWEGGDRRPKKGGEMDDQKNGGGDVRLKAVRNGPPPLRVFLAPSINTYCGIFFNQVMQSAIDFFCHLNIGLRPIKLDKLVRRYIFMFLD